MIFIWEIMCICTVIIDIRILFIFLELHEIKNKDDSEQVHSFSLMDLLPEKTTEFWRYKGSLTTPGAIGGADCAEIVIWTVFKVHKYCIIGCTLVY